MKIDEAMELIRKRVWLNASDDLFVETMLSDVAFRARSVGWDNGWDDCVEHYEIAEDN